MFRASNCAGIARQEFLGEGREGDRPDRRRRSPFPAVEKPPPRQGAGLGLGRLAGSSQAPPAGSAPLPRLNDVGRGRDAPQNRGRRANTDFFSY